MEEALQMRRDYCSSDHAQPIESIDVPSFVKSSSCVVPMSYTPLNVKLNSSASFFGFGIRTTLLGFPSWLLSARTIVSLSSSFASRGRIRATTVSVSRLNCQWGAYAVTYLSQTWWANWNIDQWEEESTKCVTQGCHLTAAWTLFEIVRRWSSVALRGWFRRCWLWCFAKARAFRGCWPSDATPPNFQLQPQALKSSKNILQLSLPPSSSNYIFRVRYHRLNTLLHSDDYWIMLTCICQESR